MSSTTPRYPAQTSPLMSSSARFSTTTPHRKQSSASLYPSTSPMRASTQSMWSSIFPDPNAPLQLPSHRRPFFSGGGASAQQNSIRNVVRNILLRPLYVLNRRGPLVPVSIFLMFAIYFVIYSTNPSSQRVKLRMQGAVGPYIPQRAANAIKWRGKQQLEDGFQIPIGQGAGAGAIGGPLAGQAAGMEGRVGDKTKKVSQPGGEMPPVRRDGRVIIEEGKPHPILALMADAKRKWARLQASQSSTFRQAVAEYVRRNGRRPPKGFDKWYVTSQAPIFVTFQQHHADSIDALIRPLRLFASLRRRYAFARAHKILLIDEFDLINKDLHIYRAFKPATIRLRLEHLLAEYDQTWIIRVVNGVVLREGQLDNHDRAYGIVKLTARFAHELPDMKIAYNGHDGARVGIAAVERERLEGLISRGEYDFTGDPFKPELKGREPWWGMTVFCPSDSVVGGEFDYGWPSMDLTGLEMPPEIPGSIGSVVGDFKSYIDVCNSPQYRHFHATTSWVYSHHPQPLAPLFSPGVQTTFADVHSIITEQFELEQNHDPLWEERPFTSLQWRGQTSGPLWESSTPWKTTQRARLHLLSHRETGSRDIVVTDGQDRTYKTKVPNYRLNPLFLDTGMVGPAVQCVVEDGTCDKMSDVFQGYDKRMSFDRSTLYKYVLDVDGNSWSGRFRRLMMSNAAVVKATVFTEFWTDWAIPWLHFIPIQVDYSDMWDVMAFFRGGLGGEGAHDDLAKEIAMEGKAWVDQCFRWVDLEAYQYRLMLEYARIYNDERSPGSNDFDGDDRLSNSNPNPCNPKEVIPEYLSSPQPGKEIDQTHSSISTSVRCLSLGTNTLLITSTSSSWAQVPQSVTELDLAQKSNLPLDVLLHIASFLPLPSVQSLGQAFPACRSVLSTEASRRLSEVVSPYFSDVQEFSRMLRQTGSLLSGSSILYVFQGHGEAWKPRDLDIVAPHCSSFFEPSWSNAYIIKYLTSKGWKEELSTGVSKMFDDEVGFMGERGSVVSFVGFSKSDLTVDLATTTTITPKDFICASVTSARTLSLGACIEPLSSLQHSTPVMAYYDGNLIKHYFPELTMEHKLKRSKHFHRNSEDTRNQWAGIEKLTSRGYEEVDGCPIPADAGFRSIMKKVGGKTWRVKVE
ncbi:hypothetical protein P7C70_g3392, partial [Phenoliferia sp. Uapishka_3]